MGAKGDVTYSEFLSTPSARRATSGLLFSGDEVEISIHALREEGDPDRRTSSPLSLYFYPRPPRGGRHKIYHAMGLDKEISIHALREEGDRSGKTADVGHSISIHALREEGDVLPVLSLSG